MNKICIDSLSFGIPVIYDGSDRYYVHRSVYCLGSCGHISGAKIDIDILNEQKVAILEWTTEFDINLKRSCADIVESAQMSAIAISFLILREMTDFKVVEQSVRGGGFDYYMSKSEEGDMLSAYDAYLEVSGILSGTEKDIKSRVREKVVRFKNMTQGDEDSDLPAYVAVVEHGMPKAVIKLIE